MVDFRATPIPQGLLEEYIKAKSVSPLQSAIGGLSSGITKGLELTDTISKIKKTREISELTNTILQTPEAQEMDKQTGGAFGLALKSDQTGNAAKTFADTMLENKRKSQDDEYNKIKTEMEEIYKQGRDGAMSEEMKARLIELSKAIPAKKYPVEHAQEWVGTAKETNTYKLRKKQFELARQSSKDPQFERLYKITQEAADKYSSSGEDVDKKKWDSAYETMMAYYNTNYPTNEIPDFETFKESFFKKEQIVPKGTREKAIEILKSLGQPITDKNVKETIKQLLAGQE